MAYLDQLLAAIADPELRTQLVAEISALKNHTDFGLVYERHLPETVVVPDTNGLRNGDLVRVRQQMANGENCQIIALDDHQATIVSLATGQERKAQLTDLLAVKRFKDPAYVSLSPLDSLTRDENRPYHAVINGENFHALQLLAFALEGQVDCIYIDPPYNTGARDWKYNNRYVDDNDSYRHSKWLSFMEKRLRLAKPLLKPDGVLIVMIDEHELHHLGMLCEELFPNHLRYVVSIVINSRGSTGTRNFGIVEEQALFVVPNLGYDVIEAREAFVPYLTSRKRATQAEELLSKVAAAMPDLPLKLASLSQPLDPDDIQLLTQLAREAHTADHPDGSSEEPSESGEYSRGAVRTGQGTSFRTQRPNQFYPIYIDACTRTIVRVGEPLLTRDANGDFLPPSWEPADGLVPLWPIDQEGRERVWCFEPSRMRREIAAGNLSVGRFNPRRNTYALNVRRIRRTARRFREITVWWEQSYDAGSNGTNILKNLLGESGTFPFPKSVYAVRDVLATVVGKRPNALILDFFAGSGTTFHATCLLNSIDGGTRRSILVTNNELESSKAESLAQQGFLQGDPEYEREGVFQKVTAPRIRAVVSGQRPDGSPVPGRYKWAGRRSFAAGFDENVQFFNLVYLNPDEVELGHCFEPIHSVLWLAAGARGPCPVPTDTTSPFLVMPQSGYAVLLREHAFRDFKAALQLCDTIAHVFFVTDSEDAYADMNEALGYRPATSMLYRDFLRHYRGQAQL